ncbi:MAG: Crp/Fnr family transcriptional regulator [Burkholderiaceae bacterium]|nr:Crp/Fnr family transcriptional regulator [Burkholderiaceae bacterium]
MATLPDELRALPLFAQMDAQAFAHLMRLTVNKRLARNEVLCSKGEAAHALYVLLEGQLRVFEIGPDGREVGLNYLLPPTVFGELAVIDDSPRSAHVVAVTPSRVAAVPKGALMQVMRASPDAAMALVRHLTAMVRRLSSNQNLLALPTVQQRVAAVLLNLAQKQPQAPWLVPSLPPQKELAMMVKASRETVSRVLNRFADDGLLRKEGKRLLLLQPEALQALVDR